MPDAAFDETDDLEDFDDFDVFDDFEDFDDFDDLDFDDFDDFDDFEDFDDFDDLAPELLLPLFPDPLRSVSDVSDAVLPFESIPLGDDDKLTPL